MRPEVGVERRGARGGTMGSPTRNDWERYAMKNGLRLKELLGEI
jgi:hypothetical protein